MSQSDKSGSGLSDSGEGSSERTKNTNNSDKNSPSTPKTKRIKLNKTVESPLTIAADGLGDSCGLFFGRSAILSTYVLTEAFVSYQFIRTNTFHLLLGHTIWIRSES